MTRVILIAVLISVAALGGCGRRGALEDPALQPKKPLGSGLIGTIGAEKPVDDVPKPEDKPFFLDFLI